MVAIVTPMCVVFVAPMCCIICNNEVLRLQTVFQFALILSKLINSTESQSPSDTRKTTIMQAKHNSFFLGGGGGGGGGGDDKLVELLKESGSE